MSASETVRSAAPQLLQCDIDGVDLRRLRIATAHEVELSAAVFELVEEHATGRLAVAAGTSALLVVGRQRPRHVVVDDEADVGLVDSHAESVGRHHRADLSRHEPFLMLAMIASCPGRKS
jgi:hypothetical protein